MLPYRPRFCYEPCFRDVTKLLCWSHQAQCNATNLKMFVLRTPFTWGTALPWTTQQVYNAA